MKRSGLRRTAPLRTRAPFVRAARLAGRAIAANRAKVTPEERAARKVVRARSAGRCEGCGTAPGTDWSHRVNASQGGPWHPANGMLLCRPCHSWLHSNVSLARALGWSLMRHQDPLTSPVRHARHGWVLLTGTDDVTPFTRKAA